MSVIRQPRVVSSNARSETLVHEKLHHHRTQLHSKNTKKKNQIQKGEENQNFSI